MRKEDGRIQAAAYILRWGIRTEELDMIDTNKMSCYTHRLVMLLKLVFPAKVVQTEAVRWKSIRTTLNRTKEGGQLAERPSEQERCW